jgi:hypothetical protein
MVPKPAHGLKHLPQPLVVGDVVADKVGRAHFKLQRRMPIPLDEK